MTCRLVRDGRIEISVLSVLIIGSQKCVVGQRSTDAECVFLDRRRFEWIRNSRRDAGSAPSRQEGRVLLSSNTLEPLEDLSQCLRTRNALNRGAGVDPIENGWRAGSGSRIADVAVRNLR